MKTVGIIGGLGPETTSEFYLELLFGCQKKSSATRPPVLIWNVPLRLDVEREILEEAKNEERILPLLIDAAKRLENGGADFLVMPCNSLHIFITEIRASVHIPVLSIVEETVCFLKKQKISRAGVIATPTSIKHRLYENAFEREGIKYLVPDEFDQTKLGRIICSIVQNRGANKDRVAFLKILEKFRKQKVKHVLMACTDLQILIPQHDEMKIFDTMKIFADATVAKILDSKP